MRIIHRLLVLFTLACVVAIGPLSPEVKAYRIPSETPVRMLKPIKTPTPSPVPTHTAAVRITSSPTDSFNVISREPILYGGEIEYDLWLAVNNFDDHELSVWTGVAGQMFLVTCNEDYAREANIGKPVTAIQIDGKWCYTLPPNASDNSFGYARYTIDGNLVTEFEKGIMYLFDFAEGHWLILFKRPKTFGAYTWTEALALDKHTNAVDHGIRSWYVE